MNPFEKIEKEVVKESSVKTSEKQSEKKEAVQTATPMQNIVIHSEIDAFMIDRIKSLPKTLDEIDVEVVAKPDGSRHQLSLPEELKPYEEKYAFCWIFKRKQAIDEACDVYHYKFANRLYFSDIPEYLFSARGIMERGDNVLMFRPKRIDEEMRRAPGLESTEKIKLRQKAHEGDPNFYIPKPESGEEKKVVGV